MNSIIDAIYTSQKVVTSDGERIPLHSAISQDDGKLILDIIENDITIRKTVEIGCAYGLSSLFIAEGIKNRPNCHHTIIDPFQNTKWKGVGIKNLKEAGFDSFELIEEKSEIALPELMKNNEAQFDLVFIDGFHTFDHTLLDCFYATRLLRIGGFLVVDDVGFPAIRRVIDYLILYPCYTFVNATYSETRQSFKGRLSLVLFSMIPTFLREKLFARALFSKLNNKFQSMVALKKISLDDRGWNWYLGRF
jgi:predicted O-methyltransferase YrrM